MNKLSNDYSSYIWPGAHLRKIPIMNMSGDIVMCMTGHENDRLVVARTDDKGLRLIRDRIVF